MSCDSFPENVKSPVAEHSRGRFESYFDGCSPVLEKSLNSAELSSNSFRHNQTPRRKLSLGSSSSTPGLFSTTDGRHRTPDNQGLQFTRLDFSTEESPYLQYRSSQYTRSNVSFSNYQMNNESSPTKAGRIKVPGRESCCWPLRSASAANKHLSAEDPQHPSASPLTQHLTRSPVEDFSRADGHLSDLRQIPGCSPLLPSPVENVLPEVTPAASLHFDSALLRSTAFPPFPPMTFEPYPRCIAEERESFPFPFQNEPEYSFSSTPLHSKTGKPSSVFGTPSRNSSLAIAHLHFTPEANDRRKDRSDRDRLAYEHARRNLFQLDFPSLNSDTDHFVEKIFPGNCSTSLSSINKDSPSSGFVSMTSSGSSGSLPSSYRSYEFPFSEKSSLNVSEKMDFFVHTSEKQEDGCENVEVQSARSENEEPDEFQNFSPVESLTGELEDDVLPPGSWNGEQQSLIGDFTRPYSLPLILGRHPDLKAISPDTMAAVIAGRYGDTVNEFLIIDCRYPYEFRGGHIVGARNVYCYEDLIRDFFSSSGVECSLATDKRSILIFHCEFSSERAPKLLRFLRNQDRNLNRANYPVLYYPEVYLLDGGYKAFFELHSELCEPPSYVPMVHCDHGDDMRLFRAKSRFYKDERGKRRLKKRSSSVRY